MDSVRAGGTPGKQSGDPDINMQQARGQNGRVTQYAETCKGGEKKTSLNQQCSRRWWLCNLLASTSLPRFTRSKRNFYRWRNNWESLQRQGEPSSSDEIKKFQLFNSVDEKICRDLCLATYNSTEYIFRVLQDSYGNKPTIAMEIL